MKWRLTTKQQKYYRTITILLNILSLILVIIGFVAIVDSTFSYNLFQILWNSLFVAITLFIDMSYDTVIKSVFKKRIALYVVSFIFIACFADIVMSIFTLM